MLTTVSVSSHAAHSGSHAPLCTLGNPSAAGFSENAMACEPLAAQRRTSCAASSGSHIGTRVSGISRPRACIGAPLTDHPVVVRADAGQRQVTVAALEERLPAEPRERGEAQRRLGVVAVHVGEPGGPVVAAGQDVVEHHRPVVGLIPGKADRGEPAGDREEQARVGPAIGPVPVGVLAEGHVPRLEAQPALDPDEPRPRLAEGGREVVLPDMGGLDDVVVDADDPWDVHGCFLSVPEEVSGPGRRRSRRRG